MSSNLETKNPITAVIMPDQTCSEKDNDRVLVGEKILHPAHKEYYYKLYISIALMPYYRL